MDKPRDGLDCLGRMMEVCGDATLRWEVAGATSELNFTKGDLDKFEILIGPSKEGPSPSPDTYRKIATHLQASLLGKGYNFTFETDADGLVTGTVTSQGKDEDIFLTYYELGQAHNETQEFMERQQADAAKRGASGQGRQT